jgi:N-acetylglucosaminyldiphosphoundecaprenol N-acetyl-beta-D-mannosaminyltransferase
MDNLDARLNVLGVGISPVSLSKAVEAVADALHEGRKGYVCVTGVHGVMESQKDSLLRAIHNRSFLTVPDGMPLVWLGRRSGFSAMDRVYGPDLMKTVCRESVQRGWKHFLYGGKEGVAAELKRRLEELYPGIRIVGTWCPPFTPLDGDEQGRLVEDVRGANADLMWIGLSTPKQERFMAEYLPRLDTKLMFGVGAAFDVLTGRMKDAPLWMKRAGLQWFHRLCQEPRRLWRRYCLLNPVFVGLVLLQFLGLRDFPIEPADDGTSRR